MLSCDFCGDRMAKDRDVQCAICQIDLCDDCVTHCEACSPTLYDFCPLCAKRHDTHEKRKEEEPQEV